MAEGAIMTPIETTLKQIGHLNKMRRDGSWLLGPCPRCGKNETLETFAIHEIASSPHWLCGRCNRSGKTIASLEAFIAGEPTPPAPPAPKTDGNGGTNGHHAKPEEKPAKPIKVKADAKPEPTTAEIIYFKAEIERLAKMPKGIERAMKRTKIARDVGVSRKDIDDEIEQQATEREVEALFEHW